MTWNRILLIGAAALAAGCTTKDEAVYWTQKKGDSVVVHHIRQTSAGLVDSTEKLSSKQFDGGALEKYDLPKDKRFSIVGSDQPVKLADKNKMAKSKTKGPESNLAEVKSELQQLRSQVADMASQNRRLEEKLNAPAQAQEPTESATQDRQQQAAQENSDAPRLSQ
jgi:hypothetical protein